MRQKRQERFWTANGGSRRDETQDGASTVVHRQAPKYRTPLTERGFLFALPQAVARVKQEKRDANSLASRLFHAARSASGRTRGSAIA
ncbi:hypothetical protein SD53_10700 [Rheinheimera mesophila]|nr:hypothetical protein SD53_10700 [Rheinheimera mesophila]